MVNRAMSNSWIQRAFGYTTDGSRIMLIECRKRFSKSRRKFNAVLVLSADGRLERHRLDGRVILLGTGIVWPQIARSKAEEVLQDRVPRAWGNQDSSVCVLKALPTWLLRNQQGLARRLFAWWKQYERIQYERVAARDGSMRDEVLPQDKPWDARHPPVITVIPSTHTLVRAIHCGVLLQRLQFGMERIYVSEYACILAPSIQATLFALAARFPTRLVVVRANHMGCTPAILRVVRPAAIEYQFRGYELTDRYQDDFGYDKFDAPRALDEISRICIGQEPRGVAMLFLHEIPVTFAAWPALDATSLADFLGRNKSRAQEHEARSITAVGLMLDDAKNKKLGEKL